jgi:hypothetical protein
VDPVGSWWGLRSNRSGNGPGLQIPIFGGRHGDVPLEREGGELVADLIVEHRLSCVLDLTTFESEGSKKKFLLDFAKRLYAKNEEPLHLFLEEADDYLPQRPMRDEAQLLRAWENIVRRGRARGLGMTMITQRSASLNKNVLTQVQTLITMRTTGPQDRAAIEAWLKYNDQSPKILAELPKLENGEAWVWSPTFLKETKKVKFPLSKTFDSGATPKACASRSAATLADVDLRAIEERMAATVERAKADDPKRLRQRVAELERELKAASTVRAAPARRHRAAAAARRDRVLFVSSTTCARVADMRNEIVKKMTAGSVGVVAIGEKGSVMRAFSLPGGAKRSTLTTPRDAGLKTMHRAMLTALAQHPGGLTKRQVLIHTSYAASGPVSTAFADLSRAGYVEADGNRQSSRTPACAPWGRSSPCPWATPCGNGCSRARSSARWRRPSWAPSAAPTRARSGRRPSSSRPTTPLAGRSRARSRSSSPTATPRPRARRCCARRRSCSHEIWKRNRAGEHMSDETGGERWLVLMAFAFLALGAFCGYWVGHAHGSSDTAKVLTRPDKPEHKSECLCGARQTCPFGVGIVGEQVCRTDLDMRNVWSRCEPAGERP